MAISAIELELERVHQRNEQLTERIKAIDAAQDLRLNDIERRLRELELRAKAVPAPKVAASFDEPFMDKVKNAIKGKKKRS